MFNIVTDQAGHCWLMGSINCRELVQLLDLVLHMYDLKLKTQLLSYILFTI